MRSPRGGAGSGASEERGFAGVGEVSSAARGLAEAWQTEAGRLSSVRSANLSDETERAASRSDARVSQLCELSGRRAKAAPTITFDGEKPIGAQFEATSRNARLVSKEGANAELPMRRSEDHSSERLRPQRLEPRTDLGGVGVRPREGKGAALVGLDGMDTAAVLRVQPDARAIGRVPQHQRAAVGRDVGLVRNEVRLALSEKGRDARDFRLVHAADAVGNPAAGATALALECVFGRHACPLMHDSIPKI